MTDASEMVEILLIADDPRYWESATDAGNLMAKITQQTAASQLDISAILSGRRGVLLRVTREDFDAAADALVEILKGLKASWGNAVRILIEKKHRDQLASHPITRHMGSFSSVEDIIIYVKAELIRRGARAVVDRPEGILYTKTSGRTGLINQDAMRQLAERGLMLTSAQQQIMFEETFRILLKTDDGDGAHMVPH